MRVAILADIPYEVRHGESRGIYGGDPPTCRFSPEEARRVALDLREGRLEIDPSWLPDTPEGREAERRLNRAGRHGDLVFAGFFAAVMPAALIGLLVR
ncbi:hypothetical protein [Streptomyces sp. NPDC096132]|uniref:hypothetical protein n=1 Tax=Streptomyces sp. NPDC096132 TaxID=3366075 RepID=UPI00380315FA